MIDTGCAERARLPGEGRHENGSVDLELVRMAVVVRHIASDQGGVGGSAAGKRGHVEGDEQLECRVEVFSGGVRVGDLTRLPRVYSDVESESIYPFGRRERNI